MRRKQLLLVVFILIFFQNVFCEEFVRNFTNFTLYELQGSKDDLKIIIDFLEEVDEFATYELGRNVSHMLVAPAIKPRFMAAVNETNLQITEVLSDFSKVLATEKKKTLRSGSFSWKGYYGVDDIYAYVTSVQAMFPSWTDLVVSGESYEGRKIIGLRIYTDNPRPGNRVKPVVFVEAGIHGREWIGPAVSTYFINQLLTSEHPNVTTLRDTFEWHIFPVVNPDGYQYSFTTDRMWRKTRSQPKPESNCYGVDANRNWDYNFGGAGTSHNPCHYQVYHGENPFSEVETRSLAVYVAKLKNVLSYIALHSYAWAIMLPHSDSLKHVSDYGRLTRIAKKASEFAHAYSKQDYKDIGTAAELKHKITGTSFDWAYHKKKVPLAFTFELRGYNFSWPERKIPELGEEITRMFVGIFQEAKRSKFY